MSKRSNTPDPREVDANSSIATEQQTVIQQKSVVDYFAWRTLPWWLCFLIFILLLTKLQLVCVDSPCAILGTPGPVQLADVKRAYRAVSKCTHPDRLRGRLGREPTPAELRRGEIIFNRASDAKDELTKAMRKDDEVACHKRELEMTIYLFLVDTLGYFSGLGLHDYYTFAVDFVWGLISFENGIAGTVFSLFWMVFFFKHIASLFMYFFRMGVVRSIVSFATTVVFGPLPTLINFIILPFLRVAVFFHVFVHQRFVLRNAEPPQSSVPSTASLIVPEAGQELPRLRSRKKKKESGEDRERRNNALLTGEASAAPQQVIKPLDDMTTWENVARAHSEPLRARQEVAKAIQFDLLLVLTKPVIPLIMLIVTGQVWNGLITSFFIGYALRQWVPQMSSEAHHLLCVCSGVVHTLLGVSQQEFENHASQGEGKVLHLVWAWSLSDVLAVLNMSLLGSSVCAMAYLGNEPSYAASYGAGIALRMFMAQDVVRDLGLWKGPSDWFEVTLRQQGLVLDAAEEVIAYSGNGIGDCGGGPIRMLLGDGPQARWGAIILKSWLMVMPLLSAAMWFHRAILAGRLAGKRWKSIRLVQRLILLFLSMLQCYLLAKFELNAANGELASFWIAMLFGAVCESFLSTSDVRGSIRQLVFMVLFIAI